MVGKLQDFKTQSGKKVSHRRGRATEICSDSMFQPGQTEIIDYRLGMASLICPLSGEGGGLRPYRQGSCNPHLMLPDSIQTSSAVRLRRCRIACGNQILTPLTGNGKSCLLAYLTASHQTFEQDLPCASRSSGGQGYNSMGAPSVARASLPSVVVAVSGNTRPPQKCRTKLNNHCNAAKKC